MSGGRALSTGNNVTEVVILSKLLKGKLTFLSQSEVMGGLLANLKSPSQLLSVVKLLKHNSFFQYKQALDVWGVDFPFETRSRYQITYSFLSVKNNARLFLRCIVGEETAISSLSGIYPSTTWLEREVWDIVWCFF